LTTTERVCRNIYWNSEYLNNCSHGMFKDLQETVNPVPCRSL